eukprot:6936749-Pyramimonas_sp.AAC.1
MCEGVLHRGRKNLVNSKRFAYPRQPGRFPGLRPGSPPWCLRPPVATSGVLTSGSRPCSRLV